MTEDINHDDNENTCNYLETIKDGFLDYTTGIPAPIRNNVVKALGKFSYGTIDIGVAWVEGKASDIRADSKARTIIKEAEAKRIAQQMQVSPEYVDNAITQLVKKTVKEQINKDEILRIALEDLRENKFYNINDEEKVEDINEEVLSAIEREACYKTSDEMRLLFGKILSREIRKPSSFSIRTIKLLSHLDAEIASKFQKFCSLASVIYVGNTILDARVISIDGNAGNNALRKYGFSYTVLNSLNEYGLITPDYNSWMDYGQCLGSTPDAAQLRFKYQNKLCFLKDEDSQNSHREIKVHGVALSNAGKELLKIIDISPTISYTHNLQEYFKKQGCTMFEI